MTDDHDHTAASVESSDRFVGCVRTDDRGVSTVLTYTLALLVVTLLTSAVFVGVGGIVENQNEGAIHSSMEVVGNRLASDVRTADRLAVAAGENGTVNMTADLPGRVGNSQYAVTIINRTASGADRYEYDIRVRSEDPEVTVAVSVVSRTPVTTGSFDGGEFVIRYANGKEKLVVSRASN